MSHRKPSPPSWNPVSAAKHQIAGEIAAPSPAFIHPNAKDAGTCLVRVASVLHAAARRVLNPAMGEMASFLSLLSSHLCLGN